VGALLLGTLGFVAAKKYRSFPKNKPGDSEYSIPDEEYAEENRDADNGESHPPANVDDDNPLTLTNIARNRPSNGQYVDFGEFAKKKEA